MKISKIKYKHHKQPIPVYCLNEPVNNEILVIGKSGKEYASYQTANLAFVFNFTPFSFQTVIRDEWSDQEIDYFIENNKLEIIKDDKTDRENKPITVATYLYNGFFKKYMRLKAYMKERQDLACEQGYIDCSIFTGARRHLPELMFISNKLSGEKMSHYSTLKNIAVNAEAQAGEALNVYIAARKIYDAIKKDNLKSKLIGCVHDSLVMYVHKTEVEKIYYILKNSMERFDYSIPILAEIEMGDIWGFSPGVTEKNIKEFINNGCS